MAKPWYDYTMQITASSSCQLYGIITNIPTALKTSNVRIGGHIQAVTGGGLSGRLTTAQCELKFKINGANETRLAYGYNEHVGAGADTGQQSFEKYINISSATKIGFNLNGQFTGVGTTPTGKFYAYIWIEMQTEFGTETFITAAKLNSLVGFVGAGSTVSAGTAITKASYNALASAVGASAFDNTYPYSSNLSTLLGKVNSRGYSKSWDSTRQQDY